MGKLRTITLLIIAAVFLTMNGCAKFPTTPVDTRKQLVITLQVRGRINIDPDYAAPTPLRHYFVAFDVDAADHPNVGPLAAIYPPYGGTGWVTSSNAQESVGLTSFIQYDAPNPQGIIYGIAPGTFFLNRAFRLQLRDYPILINSSTIRFVADLADIIPATSNPANLNRIVNVNIITTNALPNANEIVETRQIDGLGPTGQDFVQIDTSQDRIYPVEEDTDSPGFTPADADLDIVSWSIEVQSVSNR